MTAAPLESVLDPFACDPPQGAPGARFAVAPPTPSDAAAVLAAATAHGAAVLVWGAGTHQGYGHPVAADIVLSTHRLDAVVEWHPEDLTVVVEAGVTVAALEERLAGRRQTAVLPEVPGAATVGGVVAAGISGWRRLRYGPTRDRVLEVTAATGDGRVVTGGGRVVKNVTGYDLPRLATGAFGATGFIGRVCLKLWPVGETVAAVTVPDPAAAYRTAFRPLAVIDDRGAGRVYFAGTHEEIAAQAADLGADPEVDAPWPEPLTEPYRYDLRVPAARTADAVARIDRDRFAYQAAYGVGEIRLGAAGMQRAALDDLRSWAEGVGGALVTAAIPDGDDGGFDPWGGTVPPGVAALSRRVAESFDPDRVINPGRGAGRP